MKIFYFTYFIFILQNIIFKQTINYYFNRLIYIVGKEWVDITKNQVIIEQSDADSYYSKGKLLLNLILLYNLANIIFTSIVCSLHFYYDYLRSQKERIKEQAFDNLKRQNLFRYQELVDIDQNQKRDSLMKIIDLQDKRNVKPLPLHQIESELLSKIAHSQDDMEKKNQKDQELITQGIYTIRLRKDTIWKNFIDPVKKNYTIAVESVEAFSANKQAFPIMNDIESNVVVDYSNFQKTVYKNGSEEFRVLSSLLQKWRIYSKQMKVQREVNIQVDLSQYKFGDVIDLETPPKIIDYFIIVDKQKIFV